MLHHQLVKILDLEDRRKESEFLLEELSFFELHEGATKLSSPLRWNIIAHVHQQRAWHAVDEDPLDAACLKIILISCLLAFPFPGVAVQAARRNDQRYQCRTVLIKHEVDVVVLKDVNTGLELLNSPFVQRS